MKFRPLHDRVLVRRTEEEAKTKAEREKAARLGKKNAK